MGDLTPHFSSHEFKCRDGSSHPMDCRLLSMLEAIRCSFGPISITSGYRSPEYNKKIRGAKDSYHTRGMAADIRVLNTPPSVVYEWADDKFPVSGLGLYERDGGGWVHIDCRSYRARWTG